MALASLRKVGGKQSSVDLNFVSLVVPFRNEIKNLEQLLQDLSQQVYPSEFYEVIFVDDHSDDGSAEYLNQACGEMQNMRVISLDGQRQGKKLAIDLGCNNASGSWMIQTDADCRLPAGFISGHAERAAQGDVGLIAGPVLTRPEKGFWSRLESLEFMSLTATGMASFLTGKPVMCSGANLSYSLAFYKEVRDDLLSVPSPSGDDMFLLLKAKNMRVKTSYLPAPDFLVTTAPEGNIKSFFRQRIRWGSKARYYTHPDLIYLSLLVFIANVIVSALFVGSLLTPYFIYPILFSWTLKSLIEFRLLYLTSRIFKMEEGIVIFPLAALFYHFYITFAGIFSMVGKLRWKGRVYI
jgi:cellulose synthase/poly-beta-1,6-N-acetylglucosamine synthase-like glycosyltransferase